MLASGRPLGVSSKRQREWPVREWLVDRRHEGNNDMKSRKGNWWAGEVREEEERGTDPFLPLGVFQLFRTRFVLLSWPYYKATPQ